MSTYLLAFIVGEFDYVEGRDANGVLIRVYTPMTKSEQGHFALEVAQKTLPFYSNYFKVNYPLPKLDLIAIPDFSAGAMENWGLVTYRERLLLVDPKDTSLQSKQLVALVVGELREGGGGRGGGWTCVCRMGEKCCILGICHHVLWSSVTEVIVVCASMCFCASCKYLCVRMYACLCLCLYIPVLFVCCRA